MTFEFLLNLITLVAFVLLVAKYANSAFLHFLAFRRLVTEESSSNKQHFKYPLEISQLAERDAESATSTSAHPSESDSGSHHDSDNNSDSDSVSDGTAEHVTPSLPGDFWKTSEVLTPGTEDCTCSTTACISFAPSNSLSRMGSESSQSSYASDVEVQQAPKKTFRPTSALSQSERCERQITSILNKLTRERFGSLYSQLLSVCCEEASLEIIHVVAREVFAKATVQHTLAEMYAEVCSKLHSDLAAQSTIHGAAVEFKRKLLEQCQRSFHIYLQPPMIDTSLDEEEQFEHLTKYKTKMLGNVRLIAHLIRQKMLSSQIIFDCADELLRTGSAETLESLCTLLSTLGDFVDAPEWQGHVRLLVLFSRMRLLSEDLAQSSRTRILIKNVLDKRNNRSELPRPQDDLPSQMAAAPVPRNTVLLGRARWARGEDTEWGDSKKKKRQEEKRSDRQARQVEDSNADTQIGQTCKEDEAKPEMCEKPESTRRRKRGPRGKPKSELELNARPEGVRSVDSTDARSTKAISSNHRRKEGDRKSICRFFVGIREESGFQVCRRLIGPSGENMKRITSAAPEAKIRIRGTGSKYLEGPDHEESNDPLMICVSATSLTDFEKAVAQVETLLATVHDAYRNFCKSKGLPAPALALQRENLRTDALK